MTDSKPEFIWYELMTSDQDAAEAFYRAVVGWKMADAGQPGMRYTILSAGDRGIGGLMALPAEACRSRRAARLARLRRRPRHGRRSEAHRRGRRCAPPRPGRHPQRRPLRRRRRSRRCGVPAADAASARGGAAAGGADDARPRELARALLQHRPGGRLRVLFRPVRLGDRRAHGHGADGQVPDLRRRRRPDGRHDGQARERARLPPGASTSTSTASTPPWSGSRPTAARC